VNGGAFAGFWKICLTAFVFIHCIGHANLQLIVFTYI